MKKIICVLFLGFSSLFLFNCAVSLTGLLHTPDTPEEKAWLDNVMNSPFEFNVPGDQEKVAWSRAQTWISDYSGVPTKIISDSVIETEVPGGGNLGYKVTKTQKPDGSFSIKVSSVVQSESALTALLGGTAQDSKVNLHILANYIKTGDLPYPYLIRTVAAPPRPKE